MLCCIMEINKAPFTQTKQVCPVVILPYQSICSPLTFLRCIVQSRFIPAQHFTDHPQEGKHWPTSSESC